VHFVLLEFNLELSEDAAECRILLLHHLHLLLQLLVFTFHFTVHLVYLFELVLRLLSFFRAHYLAFVWIKNGIVEKIKILLGCISILRIGSAHIQQIGQFKLSCLLLQF
jgi:hypothetical protein